VPITLVSSAVSPLNCRRASPKSPTMGVKSCVRRMLFGRMSRCTMQPTRHSSS
jgi:hypothetical protein